MMAVPEFIENIDLRQSRRGLYAWIDGKMLGKVTEVVDGVSVSLMGRSFRYGSPVTDPRDQEIADLKASNERLADALAAAKERAGE